MSEAFSHLTPDGEAVMVDVGDKAPTRRTAIAGCTVRLDKKTLDLLKEKALPKGDALAVAKIAGIQAAKRTAELIPLCHPLSLDFIDVRFALDEATHAVHIEAEARLFAKTGPEMEAVTAAAVAGLALYDMVKAVKKDVVLDAVRLLRKEGGKSGVWTPKSHRRGGLGQRFPNRHPVFFHPIEHR